MAITKPPVDLIIWGSGATSSPDMVTPGAGMFSSGFVAPPTKPTRGHMNHLINKLHSAIRYFSSRSVAEWDATETQYAVGTMVFYATTGKYYRCINAAVTGAAPNVDTTHWTDLLILPGLRLARTVITTPGAFSFAAATGCKRAIIRGTGCGGSGSGARGSNNPNSRSGAAGAAGSYGEFETTVIPVNWTGTIGAVGTAGSAPVTDDTWTQGTDSTNTTVSDGTNTFTFPFGGKADNSGHGGTPGAAPSAAPGTSVTVVLAVPGEGGGDGMVSAGVVPISPVRSGKGGSNPFGSGGGDRSDINAGAGRSAGGWGAGGAGAVSTTSTGYAGSVPTGAYIEIIELG